MTIVTMTARMLRRVVPLAWCLFTAGGCVLGPDYQRPDVVDPAGFRGEAPGAAATSIADVQWSSIATDPVLQDLITTALANNLDLRIATARVEEARARYGIARSFLLPEVGASGGYSSQQISGAADPADSSGSDRSYQNWNAGLQVSWEVDLFGRVRRQSEAAFAEYLASEQGRRGVLVLLIADVSGTYYFLRQLDLQLEIAQQTAESNEETVQFYEKRLRGGISNRLELDTAIANRARTTALIPKLNVQIEAAENALSVLLGLPPGPIKRGESVTALRLPATIPVGLPVQLLERRPDVMEAEQQLVAANARVGAAKAAFFPSISLTGLYGGVSGDFSNLLSSDAEVWSVNPGVFAPIFQGGRLRSNYEASQAVYQQAFSQYQRAALNSYREVANALVAVKMLGEQRMTLDTGVAALQDSAMLSRLRYEAGLATYLEILNADQQLLDQRILLAQTEGEELRAYVELYRALGGGWQ
jgi:multidrug efflux system outer membrane protein